MATAQKASKAASTSGSTLSSSNGVTPTYKLDDLVNLPPEALEDLYKSASVPKLHDIRGCLRGRMLAVPAFPPAARAVARIFEKSPLFPWLGKSFYPETHGKGEGINRIYFGGLRMFPFETSIGPSRAGNFDALQLNYDIKQNPFFIRPVKDEIRELSPGLFLGRAYIELPRKTVFAVYFALEAASARKVQRTAAS